MDDNEWMEVEDERVPPISPLQNDLVLINLAKYFPVRDLKNVRLVCRQWCEVATTFLQQLSIVKLDENIHLQGVSLGKFLRDFATTPKSRIIFRNFRLTLWNFEEETNIILAFWEKFGDLIETLEVLWTRFVGVTMVRSLLFYWAPNMKRFLMKDCNFYDDFNYDERHSPFRVVSKSAETDENVRINRNLESLEFYGGEPHTKPPITWNEIFYAYPNLKQLLCYNLTPIEGVSILEALKSLQVRFPNRSTLRKLNVFNGDYATSEITKDVMERFLALNYTPEDLSIDIGAHCNDYRISKLFNQQRFVKKLIIYRGPLGTPMKSFPFGVTFPQLKSLEMTETVAANFEFIQFMPNLDSLSICEPPEVEPPFLPTDIVSNTPELQKHPLPIHLTRLRIDYDITFGDVRKLTHWFPNVKFLKTYLDDESFRHVCGEWTGLEELEILGDKMTESGITGIIDGPQPTIHPHNVAFLKSVRKFVMTNYGMTCELTDLSIHKGFLQMKSLNHLELCSKQITNDGWLALHNSQLRVLLCSDGRWESKCDRYKKTFYTKSEIDETK